MSETIVRPKCVLMHTPFNVRRAFFGLYLSISTRSMLRHPKAPWYKSCKSISALLPDQYPYEVSHLGILAVIFGEAISLVPMTITACTLLVSSALSRSGL